MVSQSIDEKLHGLDQLIQSKHLLLHPFYLAWSKGELSQECLKEYALHYYHHVKAFPCYLSALHSRTNDADTRRHLLNNLIDEEAGNPNHPDLWKQFAMHLGAKEEELSQHAPNSEITDLIQTFQEICQKGSTEDALAALYAYESQIPEICKSKIQGLKQHYRMQNPDAWKYFTVHIDADEEHSRIEKELLKKYIPNDGNNHFIQAANQVLDKLWNFLSALCHRYQISCSASS